jgi:hypothetical protein
MHTEILSRRQARLLHRLGPEATRGGFYLVGGSAVAVHVGHRKSVDLGWFSTSPFDPQQLLRQLHEAGLDVRVRHLEPGTLHGSAAAVRISFLHYPYPLLKSLVKCQELECRLAAVPDLAAMKLSAIAARGAKKDFVDLFAVARQFSLREMLDWYRAKFRVEDFGHLLLALNWFEDADKERMPPMFWPARWRDVKKEMRRLVYELLTVAQPA